jgi:phage gpG-like protein
MSNQFTFVVSGDTKLVNNFRRVGLEGRARLKRALQFLGIGLAAHIQKTKLSGQRLNQRSGRLISSIHEETVEDASGITTQVGTNVRYARIHEYGFNDPVQVKAHLREIKQAWGRPITPTTVSVRAYSMKMNVGEKRYMRDSLDEWRPKVKETMQKLAASMAKEATQK